MTNVNDTISGSGSIVLNNFLNESTVAATQLEGSALQVSAAAFFNFGTMIAEPHTTLTLSTSGSGNAIGDEGGTLLAQGGNLAIDSNVNTGAYYQAGQSAPGGGTIEAQSGGVVTLAAGVTVAAGLPSNPPYLIASGQIVIDGGTVDMLAGSSASVPVNFTNNGGTLELNNTTLVNASGSGVIDLGKGAQVSVNGGQDTLKAAGNDTMTASGNSDAFIFGPATGATTISGWNSTDSMQLAASDFANWNALLSHTKQVGADAIISVDTADTITLKGVTASSLKQLQFHFA